MMLINTDGGNVMVIVLTVYVQVIVMMTMEMMKSTTVKGGPYCREFSDGHEALNSTMLLLMPGEYY